MTELSRDDAVARDTADPLGHLPSQFVRDDPDLVYLDGNSLGMLPRRTRDRLADVVTREWGGEGVRGWHHWFDLPAQVGDRLGGGLLGAAAGQVLVTDSITVNLFKLVTAAVTRDTSRTVIVSDARSFPTDRYVVEGIAAMTGASVRWIESDPIDGVSVDQVQPVVDRDVAVVVLQHVDYRSGVIADVRRINEVVHAAGALTLWDLAHSVGAVPVELDAWRVDLAVGCTYKYLNAGPGAPGFLFVRRELQDQLSNPIRGWWAQPEPFDMDAPFAPAPDLSRFLTGTQSVLGMCAVDESAAMLVEVGVHALRRRSQQLVSYLAELSTARLQPLGFTLRSPTDPDRRGGHIVLAHPDAATIGAALVEKANVVPDVRPPDLIRLSPAPSSSSFVEVWEGVDRIAALVSSGGHRGTAVRRVT